MLFIAFGNKNQSIFDLFAKVELLKNFSVKY